MPYYIELTCRMADEARFRFLGLSAISHSTTSMELAGRTDEPDLVGKLRTILVPFRGFRSADEQTDPAILISDGIEFLSLPTMSGDLRPYGPLDKYGIIQHRVFNQHGVSTSSPRRSVRPLNE